MKAFLIARVSDPSQRSALPAQILRLEEYSDRLELDSELHSFDETAYKDDRRKFQEIVDKIMACEVKCIVVFDKIDRFTRDSSSETVRIFKEKAKAGVLELHFPSDGLILSENSPACDMARFGMGTVFGEYYSGAIRDNVKRKIEQKLHDGEWPGRAPIGYLNITIDKKKDIIPDPERRGYVEKMFQLRSKGVSLRAIAKVMKEDGLVSSTKSRRPLNSGQIDAILKNPFYHGIMNYDGGQYSHRYEPLISKALFDTVQRINETRAFFKNKTITRETFTFNGILKCAHCGCSISSYKKKGHTYMRCTKARGECPQIHIAESEIMPQVTKILGRLHFGADVVNKVIDTLKEERSNNQLYYKNAIEQTRKKYGELERRKSVLYEDRLVGRITEVDYDKYVNRIESEMKELDERALRLALEDKSFELKADYLLKLADNAEELFKSSQPEQKAKILKLLLANLTLDQKRLQFHLLEPFKSLIESHKTGNWLLGPDSNWQPRS